MDNRRCDILIWPTGKIGRSVRLSLCLVRPSGLADSVNANAILSKRFNLIWVVQSLVAEIFRFPPTLNRCHLVSFRAPQEGRFAIVTDVGRGMRWTRAARLTNRADADGKAVWSWRPDAGVKLAG